MANDKTTTEDIVSRLLSSMRIEHSESTHTALIKPGLEPVSYTHLDVYKRQVPVVGNPRLDRECNGIEHPGPDGRCLPWSLSLIHI